MASAWGDKVGSAGIGEKLLDRVARHGSAAHPYLVSHALLAGAESPRNLSDAVHFLCMLHGRHPGVVDHAEARCAEPALQGWCRQAVGVFAAERAFLTRLAVAAGPIPSTPGGRDTEPTVLAQRHAIETLAQSERRGCALGAALAVLIDWSSIRLVLEAAAGRFGIDPPVYLFSDSAPLRAFAGSAAPTTASERALLFGAEQIAVQHRGLWDLLEARQQARCH